MVWLTFDDGPHPEYTPRLLNVMRDSGVKGTFFLVGVHAQSHPELVRRIASEGHAIGHHTFHHKPSEATSARGLLEEVAICRNLLRSLTGRAPSLFRPPNGKLSLHRLCRLWAAGQQVVLWNVDPKDFALGSASELADWFRGHPLLPGDVVLLHDNHPYVAEALPEVIVETRSRGLEFATLGPPTFRVGGQLSRRHRE